LTLASVKLGADITRELRRIANQIGRKGKATRVGAGGRIGICSAGIAELQVTGTVLVTGYAQIKSAPNVHTELQAVITDQLGEIGDHLILTLNLGQRAVAAIVIESLAEIKEAKLTVQPDLDIR
jgi:hypothetical protein